MNPKSDLPEITPLEVSRKRKANEDFILLDVREQDEVETANLGEGIHMAPLSEIKERQLDALPEGIHDKETEIVVFFFFFGRSAQVTAWLLSQGWKNVKNMTGGIDAYAVEVDPSIGRY